jgi:hypothetical protein
MIIVTFSVCGENAGSIGANWELKKWAETWIIISTNKGGTTLLVGGTSLSS